ncbi:hypothetical protein AVL61_13370 [Kocuria rosea subsp. polaris]|uniref:Uncharacterized protein n=1 Tax=Kocuria rosea subsp. polaris TaxID=136273 RepID=A0A0W8I3S5_KOCRO|nr:hypothetical protein [Kocuria polaris]KUG52550.1 hypothetical protein AVL61_13370 [Kocuria polaris]
MKQQLHHRSTVETAESSSLRAVRNDPGADPAAPVHCGRPMPVRTLEFAEVEDRVNHAVAQAAVDGRWMHACACGFLQETPAPEGTVPSIVPDGEAMLFRPFFTRRVLAAAGRVETAEWAFDQALADAGPLAAGDAEEQAQRLCAFESGLEAERWRLDQAVETLRDELRLAVRHGVPITLLARETGLEEADVVDLLHLGDVPAEPSAEATDRAFAEAC